MTSAQSGPSGSLVFECDFEEPPEKVWRALTEPRLLDAWLTAAESGRSDSEEGRPAGHRPPPAEYEILTAERHRLVRYLWRDRESEAGEGAREVHSTVTVELAPRSTGGTHLRLTHGEFRIVPVAPAIAGTSRVRPITSARPRVRTVCHAGQVSWRRAA
jgi:uncharacterized protein YndB with AHSA1/START domain